MPLIDNFSDYSSGLSGPICGGFDITPSDADEISQVTRAIMVSQSGDLSVELKSGDAIVLKNLIPGAVYPFRISKVLSTGTTATGITGLV
ncbi:MAG: hypothetical protein V7763_11360 [Sulfitobacter sp.]|jgi:hypothetical protein|uniref:spike base protein, RCAP_Rcc01079 family n=1 Tax=Sulfitobacter sp. TaxID=1903071 RepID=UPI000C0FC3BD|nr:hypothetical protein [Roseobacter sp.]MBV49365.1 hypothetical protein [Roseobacter sp.]PHR09431.1 MAG: hypothetical protein COB29_04570 [Sulfitobacter sp.]|tara:strand:+ start:2713 stop:2982 length:270 start_codon:yes stop_codon:yes gene_type:complete